MGQLSWVSALQDVSYTEAHGRGREFAHSPSVCCNNKVDASNVDKQWSERDILEVQPTVDKFQPSCVCIDVCVTFDAVKRLGTGCFEFVIRLRGYRKLTLGQFATSSALVLVELSNIEIRRLRALESPFPKPPAEV